MTLMTEPCANARPKPLVPLEVDRIIRFEQRWFPVEVRQRMKAELLVFRRHLDQVTCSSAWIAHCWETGQDFPPVADTTPMRACQCHRCKRTGRLWPHHYGGSQKDLNGEKRGFISYECFLEELPDEKVGMIPSSPSGHAMRAIREGRIKIRRTRTRLGGRRFK